MVTVLPAKKLAVLIDGDNTSHRLAVKLFSEVARYGVATIRRVYGDFSSSNTQGWKAAVQHYAITAHQHFANSSNKNGTDISLVIDAMDLLHHHQVEGICIVSSDSDYTPLATRLREQGLLVFGFGRQEAALSFRRACHDFVELDASASLAAVAMAKPIQVSPIVANSSADLASGERVRILLLKAFDRLEGAEWHPFSKLMAEVKRLQPTFTAKAFGTSKPITLARRAECFDEQVKGGTLMVRRRVVKRSATKAA
jgi:uncharacterized LabA/DUF88 family protein